MGPLDNAFEKYITPSADFLTFPYRKRSPRSDRNDCHVNRRFRYKKMRVRDTITVSDWFVLLCTSNCRYRKSSFKTPLQISPPPRLSTLYVGWSDMVYSRSRNWDLPLIFGGITSNFICSSFSTLHSSSFWRIDTKFWLFEKAVWRPGTIYRPSRNFAGGNAFR